MESGEGGGAGANGTVVGMEQNMPHLEVSEVHIQTCDTEMWSHCTAAGAEREKPFSLCLNDLDNNKE